MGIQIVSRPTHFIKAKLREELANKDALTNIVGVAWYDPITKIISIELKVGVSLSWDDGLKLTAFPADEEKAPR